MKVMMEGNMNRRHWLDEQRLWWRPMAAAMMMMLQPMKGPIGE